jgi:hypothetical protein
MASPHEEGWLKKATGQEKNHIAFTLAWPLAAFALHETYRKAVLAPADFSEVRLGSLQTDTQQLEGQAVVQGFLKKTCRTSLLGGSGALPDKVHQQIDGGAD